jgi:hypothetical protein
MISSEKYSSDIIVKEKERKEKTFNAPQSAADRLISGSN